MKTLIFSLIAMYSTVTWACTYDSECDYGFKCVKQNYELSGVCVGDRYDNRRPYDTEYPKPRRYHFNDKKGESCTYNTDCNIGQQCLKAGTSIYGVCT